MTWFIIFLISVIVWLVYAYNKLRSRAENVKRSQANIAATIKKRHDIAQRLSDIAASYGDHEKLTHFTVADNDATIAETNAAASDASRVIGNVQMLAERFPDLKANSTYQQLMVQLDDIESTILDRREKYNAAAESYNALRGSVPHLFYAEPMGFSEAQYYTVDDMGEEKLAVFQTDDGKALRDTMGRMAQRANSGVQFAAERFREANAEHNPARAGKAAGKANEADAQLDAHKASDPAKPGNS